MRIQLNNQTEYFMLYGTCVRRVQYKYDEKDLNIHNNDNEY